MDHNLTVECPQCGAAPGAPCPNLNPPVFHTRRKRLAEVVRDDVAVRIIQRLGDPACVCNVGVQECPTHPGRLRTPEEKKAFGIAWNARVVEGQR